MQNCHPNEHIWRFINKIRAYQCIRCLTIRHPVEPFYAPSIPDVIPDPYGPSSLTKSYDAIRKLQSVDPSEPEDTD